MRTNKRVVLSALALLLFASMVSADWVNNTINVTDTSQTITFDNCQSTIWVKNAGSTNEMYVCPWRNKETVLACTTTIGRRVDPTETKTWTLGAQPNQCWKAISIIAASTKTTTGRGDSLP